MVEPPAAAACICEPSDTLPPLQIPDVPRYAPEAVTEQPAAAPKSTIPAYAQLSPADWSSVEGFEQDDLAAAWGALKQSCSVLRKRDAWQAACTAIEQPAPATDQALRALLLQAENSPTFLAKLERQCAALRHLFTREAEQASWDKLIKQMRTRE